MKIRNVHKLPALPILACSLCLSGCRCDEDQERLETTITDLQTTHMENGPAYEIERQSIQIGALEELRGKRLDIPRIIYAGRRTNPHPRKQGQVVVTLVVDYADTRPRAEFFRIYVDDRRVEDLVEPEGSRFWNESKKKSIILYTAAWVFESSDAAPFENDDDVYIEIHNPDGVVSNRVPVPLIVRPAPDERQEPTTNPATLPAG